MADTLINSYPTSTSPAKLYAEDGTGALVRIDAAKVPNSLTGAATGQVPYVNSSGNFVNLSAGSNGQVLTLAAGIPSWASLPASSFSKISSQTVSSAVSSVVFTNIPTSGYTHFILQVYNAASAAAGASDTLNIQTSIDNGSTFRTTSGQYYSTAATAQTVLGSFPVMGSTSTFKFSSANFIINGLGDATQATTCIALSAFYASSTTSVSGSSPANQNMRMAAEAENAFRIISNGGNNITQGTFTLYGVTS